MMLGESTSRAQKHCIASILILSDPTMGAVAVRARARARRGRAGENTRGGARDVLRGGQARSHLGRAAAGTSARGGSRRKGAFLAAGRGEATRTRSLARGQLRASASASANASAPDYPTPVAHARAVLFVLWTFLLALPGITVLILATPFVYVFDRKRRRLLHTINAVWARLSILPFFRVSIEGRENLPPSSTGAVYVANHQSIMDIFVLFLLGKPFKFVSKIEVFYVPIIGLAMWLTGHVALRRMDGRSQAQTFKQCCALLKEGVSILVFPEGTRSKDGVVKDFKAGAFKMARRGEAPIVPISLDGTSRVMPHGGGFLRFYPGRVSIRIHEPLELEQDDVQGWSDRTRESILSGLPAQG